MYLFITSIITTSDLGLRLITLSWAIYDFDGNEIADRQDYLFKPTDYVISSTIEQQFNITQNQALGQGKYSYTILSEFEKALNKSSLIVAFDAELQIDSILNEFRINGLEIDISSKPFQCLRNGINVMTYCNSVGSNSLSLESLHFSLFWDTELPSEMNCIIKCFFQLIRKKLI